jgi:hypothetical protein
MIHTSKLPASFCPFPESVAIHTPLVRMRRAPCSFLSVAGVRAPTNLRYCPNVRERLTYQLFIWQNNCQGYTSRMSWFARHLVFLTTGGTATGAIIEWLVGFWKSKAEVDLLKLQKHEVEYNLQVHSCTQLPCVFSYESRMKAGHRDLIFHVDRFPE